VRLSSASRCVHVECKAHWSGLEPAEESERAP